MLMVDSRCREPEGGPKRPLLRASGYEGSRGLRAEFARIGRPSPARPLVIHRDETSPSRCQGLLVGWGAASDDKMRERP